MDKKSVNNSINLWIEGDEHAFNSIVDYYYPRLLKFCLGIMNDKSDAEELSMNSLFQIWKHKENLKNIQNFEAYLFGILQRQVIRFSRKRVIHMEDIQAEKNEGLITVNQPELHYNYLLEIYNKALLKLSSKQREIFLYSREYNLSHKDIAQKTGLSVNTVNNQISTALKIIREDFKGYPEALVVLILLHIKGF